MTVAAAAARPGAETAPGGERAPRVVSIGGKRFSVRAEVEGTFWDRFAAGRWEPQTLSALDRLVGPDAVFLDVGAWVGPTTLYAAAGGARVVALEPDPVARAALEGNLALNPALAARVTVIGAALAPAAGPVWLAAARRGKGGDSMSSLLLERSAAGWWAEAVTPAALLDSLPAGRLVINLDIEGGEYLLADALRPLLARAQAALVSWHPGVATGARRGAARAFRRIWIARRGGLLLDALRDARWARLGAAGPRPKGALRLWRRIGGPVAPLGGEWVFERGPSDA